MKRLIKWLLIAFVILLVLTGLSLTALFFGRDKIMRRIVEQNILAQTGMVAEIGSFHVGLREPVISLKDFKLRNPAGFGDTPLLMIPEVFVEYDQAALAHNKIHLTQVRFNLSELVIVKNEAGKTNLFELGLTLPSPQGKVKKDTGLAEFKKRTGLDFAGVDALKISIGTAKFIDLKNPQNNREQKIGIENLTLNNVKSPLELAVPLGLMLQLRSDNFFSDVFGTDVLGGLK